MMRIMHLLDYSLERLKINVKIKKESPRFKRGFFKHHMLKQMRTDLTAGTQNKQRTIEIRQSRLKTDKELKYIQALNSKLKPPHHNDMTK